MPSVREVRTACQQVLLQRASAQRQIRIVRLQSCDPVNGSVGRSLEADGWERRFEADAARVSEFIELYNSLGYEVTTAGLAPEVFAPECEGCAAVACRRYVTIYVRQLPRPRENSRL